MKNEFINHESDQERLSVSDIDFGLRHLPNLIEKQSEEAAKELEKVEKVKLELKVAEAKVIVRGSNGKLSATDKKALATIETENQQVKVIEAVTAYEISKIKADCLTNKFNSVRKAANMMAGLQKTYGFIGGENGN